MPVTTARNASTTTRTTPVVFNTVVKEGQETLFNSEKVSLNFAPTRRNQLGFLFFDLVAFAIWYLVSVSQNKVVPYKPTPQFQLFGLFVFSVLLAERAVLAHYKSVGIVLLVLNAVIVSMLAFGAFKRNFGSCRFGCHNQNSIQKITPLIRVREISLPYFQGVVNLFWKTFYKFFWILQK